MRNLFILMIFLMSCVKQQQVVKVEPVPYDPYSSVVKLVIMTEGSVISSATGYAVDKDHILTMEHFCEVYKNKKEFAIYGARVLNRETTILITDIKPIKHDVKMDLCLLESKNHMVTPVNFAQEFYGSTRIGKEVFSIGAPMGFFPVRVDGYIIQGYGSMTMTDDKDDSMLLSLNQNPGSSGSPVFLKSTNEVIGSVDAIDSKFSQLTSAIPLPYIREFLKIDEQQVQR